MNYDVFISYCSEDRKIADALVHHLEAKEIRCWIDHRDLLPGFSWREGIIEALEGSPGIAMVLLFSSASNKSRQVIKEISMADEENILVIPIRIENILPIGAIKLELQGRHWLDAFEGKEDRIEKAAERIKQTLTRYSEKRSPKQDSVPKSKASRPKEKELTPTTQDTAVPVNKVSASTAAENVLKGERIKLFADLFRAASSQLQEKIIGWWQNANKKIIFIAAPVIAIVVIAAFFFIPMIKDKSSTESEQKASEQAEMKPNVGSLKAEEIDFIFTGIRSTGGDVTLSIRIRNNFKKEKSVALYDITKKSWVRSKLTDKMGKGYEVDNVYFIKGGKKITGKDAGTKGVAIKPHETVSAYLHFKKVGNDVTLINLHPFIYTSGLIGSNYTEHDLPLIFSVTQ
ncbi:MAG: toll/interleukin-1 receptor domain-containing protein [Smithellaceae bacterium]|jgi:hypothetical protein